MDDFELRLAKLPLRRPTQGLDDRIRSSKPEQAAVGQGGQRLPEQAEPMQPAGEKRPTSLPDRMSPLLKLAAALLAAAVLIGSGWAAERILRKWTGISFTLETHPARPFTLPDGTALDLEGGTTNVNVCSDDPSVVERVKRDREEENKLIAEKKYKLVKTYELFSQKLYLYRFTITRSNHETDYVTTAVQIPLENVTSWDDYRRKVHERGEMIYKAVLAGKFRLIDVNTTDHWICRDADSNEKLDVQRIFNPGGKDDAMATIEAAKEPKQMQTMSWQDHLKAIRKGRRELLGVKNETLYTYEAVLDDGSEVTFVQDHPLTKLETN
jgi:hypothetical protein